MRIVKKKTRKKITRAVQKLVKKRGPEIGASLASGIASSLATLASTRAPGKGRKSNLAKLSDDVTEMLAGDDKKSPKKGSAATGKHGSTKRRIKKKSPQRHLEEEG